MDVSFPSGALQPCSGTYIGPFTFVLAAHCLVLGSETASQVTIDAGGNGIATPTDHATCNNRDGNPSNDFMASIPVGCAPARRCRDFSSARARAMPT